MQEELILRVAAALGNAPADPFAWFETTYGTPPTYEGLLEALAATQIERQALLRPFFEPTEQERADGLKVPTGAHRAAARLAAAGHVRVLITTNFDRLLETALRDEGVEPVVVTAASQMAGLAPLHTVRCLVVHLHGDYLTPTSMLNTVEELATYPAEVDKLLDRIFDDYGLLVAGWSAVYDPALRDAWSRCPNRRFSSFWVDPHGLRQEALDLARMKAVRVIEDTAERFLGQVADSVDAIERTGQRHPLTVPIAAESAKRELSGGRTAIALHDTLRRELDALALCGPLHPESFDSVSGQDEHARRLRVIEAASAVPVTLVATTAYWGTESTDRWWLDDIQRFGTRPNVGGLTNLINLTQAPATLLTYAAGVAATAAQRWDLVTLLLTGPRTLDWQGEEVPVAQFLGPDHTLNKPPKYLYAYLRPLLADHVGLGNAFEEGCQRFEYLRLVAAAARAKATSRGFSLGLPHLQVTDVARMEYVPVVQPWFRRLLATPDVATILAGLQIPDAATGEQLADEVDAQVHKLADQAAWSALPPGGGTLPSGTWWIDNHGRWAEPS
ncbi:SIR2 family protein [Pedococcus sp. P5_B7]